MVYYRKYRPQTLQELLGQENVKQTLEKAFQNNQLSHAYLFCGPKGTGKTSTARILAKMVNCEKVMSNELMGNEKDTHNSSLITHNIPCNKCASCLAITDGSHLDFIEIDAASNRGIDDIRTLRENIKLAPSSAKKKVYIIDEVHMLTTEAFNALLKTLEEPPEHVLFILATTEAHKIPQTILSRVQRLDFQQAGKEDLLLALEKIAKEEKLEVDKEALEQVAKRAAGSFRDGEKLLDQLSSKNKKISLKDVEESVGSGSFEDGIGLLEALAQKDSALGLKIVAKQLEIGVNLKEFTGDLLEVLRAVMFIHHGVASDPKLKPLAEKISLTEVVRLINLFHQALEQMKTSSIASLPLEVAVVEASQQNSVIPSVSEESVANATKKAVISNELRDSSASPQNDSSEAVLVLSEKTIEKLEESKIEQEIPVAATQEGAEDLGKLLDKWNYILETVKPYNYSLEALLRQVKVLSCEEGRVILEVPYSFHQRILEAPKSRDLIESVISDVLSKESRVSCVLGTRPVRIEEVANLEVAADDDVIKIAAEIFNS